MIDTIAAPDGLTERERTRYVFRVALFRRRRESERDAHDLADRLIERDAERDDRRLCLECKNLQADGGCFAARQGRVIDIPVAATTGRNPFRCLRTTLQRCTGFEWVTPI